MFCVGCVYVLKMLSLVKFLTAPTYFDELTLWQNDIGVGTCAGSEQKWGQKSFRDHFKSLTPNSQDIHN